MEAHLPSLDQLRNNAAECIRLAEAARTSRQKSLFIEMAERWLTLAEHAASRDQARHIVIHRSRARDRSPTQVGSRLMYEDAGTGSIIAEALCAHDE